MFILTPLAPSFCDLLYFLRHFSQTFSLHKRSDYWFKPSKLPWDTNMSVCVPVRVFFDFFFHILASQVLELVFRQKMWKVEEVEGKDPDKTPCDKSRCNFLVLFGVTKDCDWLSCVLVREILLLLLTHRLKSNLHRDKKSLWDDFYTNVFFAVYLALKFVSVAFSQTSITYL